MASCGAPRPGKITFLKITSRKTWPSDSTFFHLKHLRHDAVTCLTSKAFRTFRTTRSPKKQFQIWCMCVRASYMKLMRDTHWMQQFIYYYKQLYMFRASICPSSGVLRCIRIMLLHMVFSTMLNKLMLQYKWPHYHHYQSQLPTCYESNSHSSYKSWNVLDHKAVFAAQTLSHTFQLTCFRYIVLQLWMNTLYRRPSNFVPPALLYVINSRTKHVELFTIINKLLHQVGISLQLYYILSMRDTSDVKGQAFVDLYFMSEFVFTFKVLFWETLIMCLLDTRVLGGFDVPWCGIHDQWSETYKWQNFVLKFILLISVHWYHYIQ